MSLIHSFLWQSLTSCPQRDPMSSLLHTQCNHGANSGEQELGRSVLSHTWAWPITPCSLILWSFSFSIGQLNAIECNRTQETLRS